MDLTVTRNLSQEENFEIASVMHASILDELIRATDWIKTDAVFHGGTSLAIIRESVRFSEDLDFMITEECVEGLETAVRSVHDRMSMILASHYPGGQLDLKGPKGKDVCQWLFVWSHPARRGNVQVKAEFLITKKDLLAAYASTHIVPNSRRAVLVKSHVPVPVLVSAWADKIKAIATRPAFKWRDAYDLSYISRSMVRESLDDAAKARAIKATAAIYGTSMAELENGLRRVMDNGVFEQVEAFQADMKRWFDADTYERMLRRDIFRNDLEVSAQEVADAIAILHVPKKELRP
ncbi:nucleotidyl transferase AbiEii/AbiGii toxin family protein [Agrobacterium salinitolerans]|nr:nucleotidyl transferase AbiEii/AbiGii toxin family protein [Agrobacterium salinitolerans]